MSVAFGIAQGGGCVGFSAVPRPEEHFESLGGGRTGSVLVAVAAVPPVKPSKPSVLPSVLPRVLQCSFFSFSFRGNDVFYCLFLGQYL